MHALTATLSRQRLKLTERKKKRDLPRFIQDEDFLDLDWDVEGEQNAKVGQVFAELRRNVTAYKPEQREEKKWVSIKVGEREFLFSSPPKYFLGKNKISEWKLGKLELALGRMADGRVVVELLNYFLRNIVKLFDTVVLSRNCFTECAPVHSR